jgi:hypothetical protein
MSKTGPVLHRLAAEGDHRALSRALSGKREDIDTYAPYRGLEDIIIRHGLKGTPLHVAVAAGSRECVELLLESGADPSLCVIQSERGDEVIPYADALYLARESGREDIARLILEKG